MQHHAKEYKEMIAKGHKTLTDFRVDKDQVPASPVAPEEESMIIEGDLEATPKQLKSPEKIAPKAGNSLQE